MKNLRRQPRLRITNEEKEPSIETVTNNEIKEILQKGDPYFYSEESNWIFGKQIYTDDDDSSTSTFSSKSICSDYSMTSLDEYFGDEISFSPIKNHKSTFRQLLMVHSPPRLKNKRALNPRTTSSSSSYNSVIAKNHHDLEPAAVTPTRTKNRTQRKIIIIKKNNKKMKKKKKKKKKNRKKKKKPTSSNLFSRKISSMLPSRKKKKKIKHKRIHHSF